MANGPLTSGAMRGIDLYLTQKQIGLREQELKQQGEEIELKKTREKIAQNVTMLQVKNQPADYYNRFLTETAVLMGVPKDQINFGGKEKEATQEALGIYAAFQKNPKAAGQAIQEYINRYRSVPGAVAQFEKTKEQLDTLGLEQADQMISERLQGAESPEEVAGLLSQMAQSDKNKYVRGIANERLKQMEAVKDVVPTQQSAKGVTTPELALRAAQGDADALKAMELMSPRDRAVNFVELAIAAAKGDETAVKAMDLIIKSKDSPVAALLRKSLEDVESGGGERTDKDILGDLAKELQKAQEGK